MDLLYGVSCHCMCMYFMKPTVATKRLESHSLDFFRSALMCRASGGPLQCPQFPRWSSHVLSSTILQCAESRNKWPSCARITCCHLIPFVLHLHYYLFHETDSMIIKTVQWLVWQCHKPAIWIHLVSVPINPCRVGLPTAGEDWHLCDPGALWQWDRLQQRPALQLLHGLREFVQGSDLSWYLLICWAGKNDWWFCSWWFLIFFPSGYFI